MRVGDGARADLLDGRQLENGELLRVVFPDKTVITLPVSVIDGQPYFEVRYCGQFAHVWLLGLKATRVTPAARER